MHKSEVSGPEKRAVAVRQISCERLGTFRRTPPIAAGQLVGRNPDFTNHAGGALLTIRGDDDQPLPAPGRAATDQRRGVFTTRDRRSSSLRQQAFVEMP